MAEKHIETGDKVQWNYGAGHPQGVAAEIKTHPGEKVQIETQKGNIVSRNADEENPAIRIERQGDGNNQDVVKRMSELTKVGEGKEKRGEEKEPGVGEKRERETMEKQDEAVAEGTQEKTVEGERAGETKVEKATKEGKKKEPKEKKAKLDEQGEATTKEQIPRAKSTRGRGRSRGQTTTATTGTRRTGGRTKKASTESQDKSVSTATASGEGKKVEDVSGKVDEAVMSEAIPEANGEEKQRSKVEAGEAPSESTRSKGVQVPAHN